MSDLSTSASDFGAVDDLCEQFRESLRRGERPRVEDWLARAGPDTHAAIVRLALLQLDYCVRAGELVSATDFFSRFPQLKSDPTAAREMVRVEFLAARSRDPGVRESTFRDRYPDLADSFPTGDGSWVTVPQDGTAPFQSLPSETPLTRHSSPHDPLAFLKALLLPPTRPGDVGRLDQYRVAGILGQGGMGVVLRGEDTVLHRAVALKVMRPEVAANPLAKERFLREARAMAAVEHPRVVIVHHIGEWRGTPFLVMPLMKGCSLGHRVKHGPPVGIAEAVRFAREAAEGLGAAHAQDLVHRDVKPDNLWLEESADGIHVRVLDFGLVRDDGADSVTRTGTVFGTPAYMAPEQAAGERVDGRADLFSLGCVLYELATGTRPFRGDSITAILFALANHTPPAASTVNPEVPEPLSALIDQLLAKRRDKRPASAKDVVAALKALEGESPSSPLAKTAAWEPADPPRPTQTFRGRSLVAVLGALTAIVALVSIVVTQWPSGGSGSRRTSSDDTSQSAKSIPREETPVAPAKSSVVPKRPSVTDDPAFKQWIEQVASQPPARQLELVAKKLQALNQGFDGKLTNGFGNEPPRIENDMVTTLGLSTSHVTDISPVRALGGLKWLNCDGNWTTRDGKLSDLSPLQGLRLNTLSINYTQVVDISPLAGMPLQSVSCFSSRLRSLEPLTGMQLTNLVIGGTDVADLAPLRGMRLNVLNFGGTLVSDLSPLQGMPLVELGCASGRVSDLSPLEGMKLTTLRFKPEKITKGMGAIRQMKTLVTIDAIYLGNHEELAPDVFWKKYDAGAYPH